MTVLLIILNLKNMRMPTDEQIRPVRLNQFTGVLIVPSGISGNVGHHHLYAFNVEDLIHGKLGPVLLTVYVSPHCTQWFPFPKMVRQFDIADISGMPDLIALLQVLDQAFIKVTVGI